MTNQCDEYKNYQPRILYPGKMAFKSEREMKFFRHTGTGNSLPADFPAGRKSSSGRTT